MDAQIPSRHRPFGPFCDEPPQRPGAFAANYARAAAGARPAPSPAAAPSPRWPVARTGAGISAAAMTTSPNAAIRRAMTNGSVPSGSLKTTTPARMAVTLLTAEVIAMTGTASPTWSERAEAKKAPTKASTISGIHGVRNDDGSDVESWPVSALMPTWLTVKSRPAPAPSSGPAWPRPRGCRWKVNANAPMTTSPASNAIAAPTGYDECSPWVFASLAVTPRSARPAVVRRIPIHSRLPTLKPNQRSAIIASITKPLASTAWTSDSGARLSDATCSAHATNATPKPIDHHFGLNRARTVRHGWRTSTSGAAVAPRWRMRKPMSVASADSAATPSPTKTTSGATPPCRALPRRDIALFTGPQDQRRETSLRPRGPDLG